ncbi:MAG: heme NO-binding domain-containing protein [Pseudomonadota bacterium]
MYGIIHRAIRSTVLTHADDTVWASVLDKAGLSEEHFLSPAPYSDAVTYRLVDSVADTLGLDRAEAFRVVGRHWVEYATGAGYGSIFSMAGEDLGTFLSNLDRMHNSLRGSLPDAKMPSFDLTAASPNGWEIFYKSERTGLATFVEGILEGVCIHYGEDVRIEWHAVQDGVQFTLDRLRAQAGLDRGAGVAA